MTLFDMINRKGGDGGGDAEGAGWPGEAYGRSSRSYTISLQMTSGRHLQLWLHLHPTGRGVSGLCWCAFTLREMPALLENAIDIADIKFL